MEHSELTDEIKEQSRERKAEGEPAETAESGNTALSLDDLDGAAGGRAANVRKRAMVLGPIVVGSVEDRNREG